MSDRVEYWWVTYNAETQPAEVSFRGGIPVHARLIGTRDLVASALFELVDRLPTAPEPVLRTIVPAAPPSPQQSTSPLLLIGLIALIVLTWFSGDIFDLIQ